MQKRLYKLFALLILPIFLVACEHGAENKVNPEVLAATLQKAMDTANALDNMNMKAFGMAKVGLGMATVDRDKANQSLNEAMRFANEARSEEYRAVLAELRGSTADWPAAEKEQIADALDRIERATYRVWVVRAVAEGLMVNDRSSAETLLMGAANAAMSIPDPRYRDLDLRSVAALLARANVREAESVSARISDPRIRAWSLIEIGKAISGDNPDEARRVLLDAARVAGTIPSQMKAESALIVADAEDETRNAVLGAETAKIAAASARAISAAAVAMSVVDHGAARTIASSAASTAMSIDANAYPYTRAYAMSDVAIDTAAFDAAAAQELADKIGRGHEDAAVAALLAVIKAKSASANPTSILSDISKAEVVAEAVADRFDKAKALAALSRAAIPFSKEKAVEIAGMIEESLGHNTYSYSLLKDDVLADVAIAWAAEDTEMAKKMLEPTVDEAAKDHGKYVVEPRFSKNAVLHTKARAYLGMADAAADPAVRAKLYTKAAGAAADAKSARLQWEIAKRLCMADASKLFDFAATIPVGDFESQALALADIAAGWSEAGNPSSVMVWDMAAKAANMLGDDMESSDLLNRVAARCAAYDAAKATEIYAASMNRLEKIGMEKG